LKDSASLQAAVGVYSRQQKAVVETSGRLLAQIETVAEAIYDVCDEDRKCVARFTGDTGALVEESIEEDEAEETEDAHTVSPAGHCEATVSFLVGTAFGRWDIRFATGRKPAPELPDPFARLPVCPPGQLQSEQGLPITKEEVGRLNEEGRWDYPVDIPWEGILVDDPGHLLDLETRVHQVLQVIWKNRWEVIEQEACEILGVKDLREYFRKPALFFAEHLKRYSKSRRQAPIYWPLSTASGSYTLWIYYHRLTDQTLFIAADRYVGRKIEATEKRLRDTEAGLAAASGREASKLRDTFEKTKAFLDELVEFREELLRVANLPYKPDLNDGVLINAAPLWKLFRLPKWRKDLEACWKELEAGEYDWSHMAYTIWPDRVREKCKSDRSIAIAHGLESLYEGPARPVSTRRTRRQPEQAEFETEG
jgi:hypothetical protein